MGGVVFPGLSLRAATRIVAASDSRLGDTGTADFICDGVADDVEINAAIASLPPSGGRVLLLEGTYNLLKRIELVPRLTLEGQGRNHTILKVAPGFVDGDMNNADARVIRIAVSDVVLKSFQIDGNKANVAGFYNGIQTTPYGLSNIQIEDVLVKDCSQGNYAIVNANNCRILNCESLNPGHSGFAVFDGLENRISHCRAVGGRFFGYFIRFCLLENCTAVGCRDRGIFSLGESTIINCEASFCFWGISLHNNSRAIGNFCHDNLSGIVCTGRDCIITNNSCIHNRDFGIEIPGAVGADDNIMDSNTCIDNGLAQIGLHSGATNIFRNTIKNNYCRREPTNWYGILIQGSGVIDTHIINNRITGGGVSIADAGTNTRILSVSEDGRFGFGITPPTGVIDLLGDLSLRSITVSLGASVSDVSTSRISVLRLSSSAAVNVGGFSDGFDGKVLYISNVGTFNITILNETSVGASPTPANRVKTGTGADIILPPDDTMILVYDGPTARWRVYA